MKLLRLLCILTFVPLVACADDGKAKPAAKECCKDKDGKECAADKAEDKDSCCADEKPADQADAKKTAKK